MRQKNLFLIILSLSHQTLGFGGLARPEENDKTAFTNAEHTLIKDLISGSEQERNFIFIGSNMDIDCSNFTCEKYALVNLDFHLSVRGERIYSKNHIYDRYYTDFHERLIKNVGSSQRNIIIFKLASSSNEDVATLNQIRAYNMKSFLVVFAANAEIFLKLKHYILTSDLFNIYVIKEFPDNHVQLVYEVCAYCNDGKHKLEFYNGWQQSRGFLIPFKFSSSFKKSFYGAKIRVGTVILPPVIFPTGESAEGLRVYAGQEYWLLKTLAKLLNFRIKLVISKSKKPCFLNLAATHPTSYCKQLYRKEVELAGFPQAIRFRGYQFLDPTGIYHVIHNRLISVKPVVNKEPGFRINTTLCIVLIVICINFAFLTVLAAQVCGENNVNDNVGSIFQVLSALFLEAVRYRSLRLSNMIIFGLWLMCCFFVIFNYFGEMISTSTVAKPLSNYINTLEDLKDGNISWIIPPNLKLDNHLEVKLPEQAKHKLIMPLKQGLEYLLQTESSHVYIYPKEGTDAMIRLKFWDGKGENPFHFSPPVSGDPPMMLTVLVRKDSPFTKEITKKILQIDAAGLFKHKFMPDTIDLMGKMGKTKSQRHYEEDDRKHEKVSLPSLSLYLYVWLFMLCVATFVFIVEVFSLCITMRYLIRIIDETRNVGPVSEEMVPIPAGPAAQNKELPSVVN